MKSGSRTRLCTLRLTALSIGLVGPDAHAQELLQNRSFETPVGVAPGNNLYVTIPDWTAVNVTPVQAQPFNIVRPWLLYVQGPTATPTGGGAQYLDIAGASGAVRQSVTIPAQGMIDFSAWFSVREFAQAITGTINIIDSGGNVVATTSIGFSIFDLLSQWKQAASVNLPVSAGTYTIELVIPDYMNVDLASLVFKPAIALIKTSAPVSDPVNGSVNPKHIPGSVAEYTIAVTTPSSYTVSASTILISDPTPANTDLVVADIGGAGSGPAAFTPGTSGLSYTFAAVASTTDDIEFSNNGGASWTYVPSADANGVDAGVTTVRLRPKGVMAASSTATFRLRYRVR